MTRLGRNQPVTAEELRKIRALDDFDLKMLVSEIHDHGWRVARVTLRMMPPDARFPDAEAEGRGASTVPAGGLA